MAVPYFHVVFTLPKELHAIVRRHQRKLYGLLMQAAAQSLLKLAADPRYVGGRLGILAVLHTWTTTLTYHPHVHCLVPGGGISQDRRWVAARREYLVPVKALAVIFRGMFLEMLRKALPHERISNSVWTTPWVVYCKPTVQGTEKVLQYLARYVHRVAFANSRLLSLEDGQVRFAISSVGNDNGKRCPCRPTSSSGDSCSTCCRGARTRCGTTGFGIRPTAPCSAVSNSPPVRCGFPLPRRMMATRQPKASRKACPSSGGSVRVADKEP